jgi:heavy metal translocating P-type ATPase
MIESTETPVMQDTLPEVVPAATSEMRRPLAERIRCTCAENFDAVSALSALAFFLIGLGLHAFGAPQPVSIAAFLVCYVIGGWEPGWAGLVELKNKRLDVDLLMVVAAIAAAAIGQWLEGALLIVIFSTSGALETFATRRTEAGVRALMKLAPEEAMLLQADGTEVRVRAETLSVGHTIVVRPGERVGADGVVLSGSSDIDESSITGESVPVEKRVGEEVFAGTINGSGAIEVRVSRASADSVIARIASMVEEAKEQKAKTQLFIEGIEQRYSIGMVGLTVLLLTLPVPLLGWTFEETLLRAMTFMIVASPCAVVLATMPPLLSAIATATRMGVLVKGGIPMEALAGIDTIAFDKTGTMTEGAPTVTDVLALGTTDSREMLRLAAAAEAGSEHPLGRAIVEHARTNGIHVDTASEFEALPGRGVRAMVDGRQIRIGSRRLLDLGEDLETSFVRLEREGKAALAVECDGEIIGVIACADTLRPDAAGVVRRLRAVGVTKTVLLTGDNQAAADLVASATGVDEVYAGLLPADKVERVRELQGQGRRVLLVGDGVNDAPALAAAELGIAMGGRGTDVALETADAVLVTDRLERLPEMIELSRRANRVVKQNLVFAAVVILSLVTIDLAGHLPLPLGVVGHEGSTILVALNGLRLLRRPKSEIPR